MGARIVDGFVGRVVMMLAVAVVLVGCTAAPQEKTLPAGDDLSGAVTVDLSTAVSINGHDEVSRNVFGIFAVGSRKKSALPERYQRIGRLNPGVVRIHPDIRRVGWQDKNNPGQLDPRVFDYDNAEWIEAWKKQGSYWQLAAVEENLQHSNVMLLLGSLPTWLVKDSGFRAKLHRKGIKSWAWTSHPKDFDLWAEWAVGHVEMFHDNPLFPKAKLKYVEILNEPSLWCYFGDREDYKDPTRPKKTMTGEKMVPKYIKTFNTAARAIKAKYPELKICGPVLHQGFTWRGNWGWNLWLKPFLKECGPYCDIIDFHPYGHFKDPTKTGLDETTDIGMNEEALILEFNALYRYQQLHSDRIRPVILTELSTHFNMPKGEDGQWETGLFNRFKQKQLLWIARLWRQILDEPAKVEGITYYHSGPSTRKKHAQNVYGLMVGENEPAPLYDFFEMLRDLGGTRLATTSPVPGVQAVAAVNDGQLVIWLTNDQDAPASFDLALKNRVDGQKWDPTGKTYRIELIEGGLWTSSQGEVSFAPAGTNTWQTPIEMPAYGMMTVTVPLSQKPPQIVRTTDYFGGETMVPVPQRFRIDLPATQRTSALLRLGLRNVVGRTPVVRINGRGLSLDEIRTHGDGNSLVERKVPLEYLRDGENTIELTVPGADEALMAFTALRVTAPAEPREE